MLNEKMWALYVHLGITINKDDKSDKCHFDDEMWDYILDESQKSGINTILVEANDGIAFESHPEISNDTAWKSSRVREEIAKCKSKNISLIPLLNFASPHDAWLAEYHRKLSTPEYYAVCRDLIKEVYDMFEHPEYIHIGMDEEDAKHVKSHELAVYRQGELYWHDLKFYIDCVNETGAKPWIWSCSLFDHPEEYKKHIGVDNAVISPWYYNAFNKEHWTPISSRDVYVTYYNEGEYANMGLKYVEEDPFLVNFRKVAIPLMNEGYKYIPCASVCNRCDWNTHDLVEYFKDNAPDEQVLGFMTAPWSTIEWENKKYFDESFKFLKEAKEKFYK